MSHHKEQLRESQVANDGVSDNARLFINKADIKAAANSILACEKTIAPSGAKNKWKAKADVMQGKVMVQRLSALGEPMPMLQKLLGTVWETLSGKADHSKAEIESLVGLALPEITRLRIEREAELESDQVMAAMNSLLTGSIPHNEASGLLYKASRSSHKLKGEADILEASCKLSTLIPIFLHDKGSKGR